MSSNAIILSTSSSSYLYDVFLSFRGEDTRYNFTAFLFQALRKNGIHAFKDDAHLKKGDSIAPELLQAIQASRIFIIVFSKDYASSTWCLRELVQICNCIGTSSRHVLPIFYDVHPSEVRKQSGYFEKAFVQHEQRFREDKEKMEEVQRWRHALTQVANISGWDVQNESQPAMIQQIVQRIKNIIGPKFLSLPNDNLVGVQSGVEELEELLCLDSVNEVRVVGISGMSGIGKSTVARALYEKIADQYNYNCFIDVREIHRQSGRLDIQKQLLSLSSNGKDLEIYNVSEGTCLVWNSLHNARALVIFDNVDKMEQLQIFSGNRDSMLRECLGGGSRIIIISRNEQILKTHGVDDVYQVQRLGREDAYELFCKKAFRGIENTRDYEKVMDDILSYADGHPLAIQVLGSSMVGRSLPQWESTLAKLKEHTNKDIMEVLRLGFDELDDTNKEIFLDIACFLYKHRVQEVTEILDFRGFHPKCGLQDLIDKSLITIVGDNIYMHNLLMDLGRCIVKEKSPNQPSNWSRLWEYKDLQKIMSNMAAENLEAIAVMYGNEAIEKKMNADIISKLSHLKLLAIDGCFKTFGSLDNLSNELGYLRWSHYPFESLPPSFQTDKLIDLSLRCSRVKQLWKGTKPLHNLKRLNLSYSKSLTKMPDLGEAMNLECINMEGCIKLKQIHSSIGLLRKLTILNLKDCTSLIKLPYFNEDLNLEKLSLSGCIQLQKINPSIGLLRNLIFLTLKDCTSLIKLPHFQEALNLEVLNLEGCIQLQKINPSIGLLIKLNFLNLKDCKSLVSLPNSILGLNSLTYLNLSGCSKLFNKLLLGEARDGEAPIHSHSTLSIINWWLSSRAHKDSVSCLFPSSSTFPCLRQLYLSFCNLVQIPDAIENLSCLELLNLSGNNFAKLPNLKECSKLCYLNLEDCKQLKYLPQLPSRTVWTSNFYSVPREFVLLDTWPFGTFLYYNGYDSRRTYRAVREGANLNIFNCPKIVDRELTTSMAVSWIIQIGQVIHHIRLRPLRLDVVSIIPGSEIPRWFNNQHVGLDSLSSPVKPGDGCVGVLACVVFGTPYSSRYDGIEIPAVLAENLVTDISDHMLLVYLSPESLARDWTLILQQKFVKVEVKKYGYHIIYKEDLELSKLIMDSGNS